MKISDELRTSGWCGFCLRMRSHHCHNTREMEDAIQDAYCHAALMRLGGGEYTVRQREAAKQRGES